MKPLLLTYDDKDLKRIKELSKVIKFQSVLQMADLRKLQGADEVSFKGLVDKE